MANRKRTYPSAACIKSVWSPQLCQMKHIIINDYSVKLWDYENESQNVIEIDHITCYVLADMKILFVDKVV